MKTIRKVPAKKQNLRTDTLSKVALSQAEIAAVSGGINPQPLPPAAAPHEHQM